MKIFWIMGRIIVAFSIFISGHLIADPACNGEGSKENPEACELYLAQAEYNELIANVYDSVRSQESAPGEEACPTDSFLNVFSEYHQAWRRYIEAECNLYCRQGGCGGIGWDNELCVASEIDSFGKKILSQLENGNLSDGCIIAPVKIAPSFDCKKASSKAEILVCENKYISLADRRLSKYFKLALSGSTDKDKLLQSQRDWLKNERDVSYDDPSIMLYKYFHRINELKSNKDKQY